MLTLRQIRSLITASPAEPGRPAHLSAGSGLVLLGGAWFLVADDERTLARFPRDPGAPGEWLRPHRPPLPLEPAARKARKPDWEILVPGRDPHRELLALPSGSAPARTRGASIRLDAKGQLASLVEVDCAPLFSELGHRLAPLNLEGAAVSGRRFALLQRGTGSAPSALVWLGLDAFWEAVEQGQLTAALIEAISPIALPMLEGRPLSITDACGLDDGRIAFTAAAEATDDPYLDAPCAGSAIGVLAPDGTVLACERVEGPAGIKLEGIWVEGEQITVVDDPDDPAVASRMFEVQGAEELLRPR